jgi:hypothetical protein
VEWAQVNGIGYLCNAEVAFDILLNEFGSLTELAARKSAERGSQFIAILRVVPEQVHGQNIPKRLGIKAARRAFRFNFSLQRHADLPDYGIAHAASFDKLDPLGDPCFGCRARKQSRVQVD